MELTIKEKQLLCSLKLKENARAREFQQQIAHELLTAFDEGGQGITRTQAAKYRKLAGIPKAEPVPKMRTKKMHEVMTWYKLIRGALVGLDGVAGTLGHAAYERLLSIGGLSYGFELLAEAVVLAYETFKKSNKKNEENLTYGQRFNYALNKGNHRQRIANAALKFAINFSCFFLSGGLSAFANLFGFAWDVGVEMYNSLDGYKGQKKLFEKFSQQRALKEQELGTSKDAEKPELRANIASLKFIEQKLKTRIHEEKGNYIYNMTVATLILFSAALSFFPPTSALGVPFLIASFSLIAESVLEGLGRKLFGMYKQHKNQAAKEQKIKVELQNNHPSIEKPIANSYVTQCPQLIAAKNNKEPPSVTPHPAAASAGHACSVTPHPSTVIPHLLRGTPKTNALMKFNWLRPSKKIEVKQDDAVRVVSAPAA